MQKEHKGNTEIINRKKIQNLSNTSNTKSISDPSVHLNTGMSHPFGYSHIKIES